MLIKSKICFTILVVYEIIAVSALHFKRVCDSMFATSFCDGWFRYFLFCVVVPLITMLIIMWIREIVHAHRRRRLIRRARSAVNGILSSIRGKIATEIDLQDMEKIVTAAVLVGIKKYADRHPNIRQNVNHIMDVASGRADLNMMSTDDEKVPQIKRTATKKSRK